MNQELFNLPLLNKKLEQYTFNPTKKQINILNHWNNFLHSPLSKNKTEKQLQSDFLNDIFGTILGYTFERGKAEINLEKELKTAVDGKKPDGGLGFFSPTKVDCRVVIELKAPNTNLDTKQNRINDNRTPVEQAFSYKSKYQNIEFVIVSNFNQIRLYQDFEGSYHSFTIKELAENAYKFKEFYFILSKNRLFTSQANSSIVHSLLDHEAAGESIEKRFYQHYKTLRQEIWHDLLENNTNKPFGRNFYLYKAQKLIDRIIFIRFCRENGALDNDVVLDALKHTFVPTAFQRLQFLFTAMNEGRPAIGIAKFNGGLFAPDPELDSLEVSDDVINKIVELYSYDFGSDLDVNILGHIFEQSISDLENLAQNNDKKEDEGIRKKDGIFYTPAAITEYIIAHTIGSWLEDRKAEITAPVHSKQWWQEYAEKLKQIKVVDPSCGSGAFLVKVFDYLQQQWQEVKQHIKTPWDYKDILTHNIYGVDINVASVGITKLSLWLKTAHHREPLTTLDNNIKIGNSLIDDKTVAGFYHEYEGETKYDNVKIHGGLFAKEDIAQYEAAHKKSLAFSWQQEFPDVFKQGGFDIVIGNPPYIRQQKIIHYKQYLRQKYNQLYTGTADLYVYFYALGLTILKPNGYLGYITSNKWMRTLYGEKLRSLLLTNTAINQLIDLGPGVFDSATVDSNIILIKHLAPPVDHYTLVGNKLPSYEYQLNKQLQSSFTPTNFVIAEPLLFSLQQKIEIIGTTLKNWDIIINLGIVTSLNEAFVIDESTKNKLIQQDPKSAEVLKPILRGRDIHRYSYSYQNLWIIATHNGYNGVPAINIDHYPAIKRHLELYQPQLTDRSDQGNTPYNLRNCAYWQDFEKEKIILQRITCQANFTYETQGYYPLATCYIITGPLNLKYLLPILSSRLMAYAYRIIYSSGDLGKTGYMYQRTFLEKLPVPKIEPKLQQPFIDKADIMLQLHKNLNDLNSHMFKLLQADSVITKMTKNLEKWYLLNTTQFIAELTKQNPTLTLNQKSNWVQHFETEKQKALALQNQIELTDNDIDHMVYKLYNLTDEEIKLVEDHMLKD